MRESPRGWGQILIEFLRRLVLRGLGENRNFGEGLMVLAAAHYGLELGSAGLNRGVAGAKLNRNFLHDIFLVPAESLAGLISAIFGAQFFQVLRFSRKEIGWNEAKKSPPGGVFTSWGHSENEGRPWLPFV